MNHKSPLVASAVLLGVIALCIAVPILLFGGVDVRALPWFALGVAALSTTSLVLAIVSLCRKRTVVGITTTIVAGMVAATSLYIVAVLIYEIILYGFSSPNNMRP